MSPRQEKENIEPNKFLEKLKNSSKKFLDIKNGLKKMKVAQVENS